MKRFALLFLFLTLSTQALFAQPLPDLGKIKLYKRSQFKPVEETVKQVITYLFNTSIHAKDKQRQSAGEFLLKWMNGTPDYTFYIEDKETSFFDTEADLLLMYMAGLAKFQLENPAVSSQKEQVVGALSFTIPYLASQENKKEWSKELWQLNDAYRNGKLQAYLYK